MDIGDSGVDCIEFSRKLNFGGNLESGPKMGVSAELPDDFHKNLIDTSFFLAANRETDILVISSGINHDLERKVRDNLEEHQSKKAKLLLFLQTSGGSPDVAFRVMRRLQSRYSNITLMVGGYCKSAGTLMAVGAHEIVMSDDSELGPLDIQLGKPDELIERTSGLIPREAFAALQTASCEAFEEIVADLVQKFSFSTKMAADVATKMVIGLFQPIYEHIDPMRLGEMQRSVMIAIEYGGLLDVGNVKNGALTQLTAKYPSHEFVIDRQEASTLFINIRKPDEKEYGLMKLLQLLAERFHRSCIVEFLSPCEDKLTDDVKGNKNEHNQQVDGLAGSSPGNTEISPNAEHQETTSSEAE